jgi:hypothetical protein
MLVCSLLIVRLAVKCGVQIQKMVSTKIGAAIYFMMALGDYG